MSTANAYTIATKQMLNMKAALEANDKAAFLIALTATSVNNMCVGTGDSTIALGYIELMQEAIQKWILA